MLKPYVEQSERENAPQLARRHRMVGFGLMLLGVHLFAGCAEVVSAALLGANASDYLNINVAMVLIPACLFSGAYFVACGVRDMRKSNHFAAIPKTASELIS